MKNSQIWDATKKYKMWRGIRDYSTHDYYWNQVPRELMSELLDLAEQKGYEVALKTIYKKVKNDTSVSPSVKRLLTPAHFHTYILDESRSKFSRLFKLRKNTKILDMGCGWGAVTVSLARKVKNLGGEIYGVDATTQNYSTL